MFGPKGPPTDELRQIVDQVRVLDGLEQVLRVDAEQQCRCAGRVDRRLRADDDAHDQCDRERCNRFASQQQQGYEH